MFKKSFSFDKCNYVIIKSKEQFQYRERMENYITDKKSWNWKVCNLYLLLRSNHIENVYHYRDIKHKNRRIEETTLCKGHIGKLL